jgi:branched-chain amino acid transport system substrate-binding protein
MNDSIVHDLSSRVTKVTARSTRGSMWKIGVAACSLSIACLGIATLSPAGAAAKPKPFKASKASTCTIGFIDSMSGPFASVGAAELAGAKFEVSKQNAAVTAYYAKLNKEKVKPKKKMFKIALSQADDQGTATAAALAFQKLASTHSVPVIVGPGIAAEAEAVAGLATQYSVPNINMTSSLVLGNAYVYDAAAPTNDSGTAMVNFLKTQDKVSSAYLLTAASPYGQSGEAAVEAAAQTDGVTISGNNTYTPTSVDFTAQATQIASANPAAILFYGSGSSVDGQVVAAIRSAGYSGPIVGDLSLALTSFPYIAGSATANVVALSPVNYAAPAKSITKLFLSAYASANGSYPSATNAYGYEATGMAAAAIDNAGACSSSAINKALNKLNYTGVLGHHVITSSYHGGPTGSGAFFPIAWSGDNYVAAP